MSAAPFYAWAEWCEQGFPVLPPLRTQAQKDGRAFESRTLKLIRGEVLGYTVLHNPWIAYGMLDGVIDGFGQPDIIVEFPKKILLIECKLSYNEMAWSQLARYENMLMHIYDRPIYSLQACKNIWQGIPHNILGDVASALAYEGRPTVWHNTR